MKAVIHCLSFPPSSSGADAMIGGAITYRNSRLNILTIQLTIITAIFTIIAMPAR